MYLCITYVNFFSSQFVKNSLLDTYTYLPVMSIYKVLYFSLPSNSCFTLSVADAFKEQGHSVGSLVNRFEKQSPEQETSGRCVVLL